jgi:hypothetical protein
MACLADVYFLCLRNAAIHEGNENRRHEHQRSCSDATLSGDPEMNGSSVVFDAVHRIIPFSDCKCDRLLRTLINTREFQRLRRIKQLGMCSLVFPGADHSRFSHSIGVMQNARRFLKRLDDITPKDLLTEDRRTVILVAALLHDVGHGPFSHAFEKITGDDHEARTLEVIADSSTDVNKALCRYSTELPDRLKVFFDEDVDETDLGQADVPAFLTQVVSSQLDADRFDYLVRDSHMTGLGYGRFDTDWLIQHLFVDNADKNGGRFYLSEKAFCGAEAYIFARYHMYRTVYYHKTIRAAEVMLRLLFKRYKTLLDVAGSDSDKQAIVPNAVPVVVKAFSSKMSLGQYLALDDQSIGEFFKACEGSPDGWIRTLGVGLLNRHLYKGRDTTGADPGQIVEFASSAQAMLKEKGHDCAYMFVDDKASDTPYKPYDPDAETPATQIYVNTLEGRREISSQSEPVATLKKKYTLLRYYFPALVRDDINSIWKKVFGKEIK